MHFLLEGKALAVNGLVGRCLQCFSNNAVHFSFRSKRSTSKMSFAINALLSESDDEDEDLLNDATQLLEEDEANRNTGMDLQHHPWHKTNDF